jgi:hypothetical protein
MENKSGKVTSDCEQYNTVLMSLKREESQWLWQF